MMKAQEVSPTIDRQLCRCLWDVLETAIADPPEIWTVSILMDQRRNLSLQAKEP